MGLNKKVICILHCKDNFSTCHDKNKFQDYSGVQSSSWWIVSYPQSEPASPLSLSWTLSWASSWSSPLTLLHSLRILPLSSVSLSLSSLSSMIPVSPPTPSWSSWEYTSRFQFQSFLWSCETRCWIHRHEEQRTAPGWWEGEVPVLTHGGQWCRDRSDQLWWWRLARQGTRGCRHKLKMKIFK